MKTLLKTRPTRRLFAASLLALFAVLFFPTFAAAQMPGKVVIFQVENQAGQNSILLKWGHVNIGGSAIIDYTIQRKTGTTGTFAELEISTTILAVDTSGTTNHIYRIRARNDAGFGLWSEETPVDSTGIDVLTAPRGLTAD